MLPFHGTETTRDATRQGRRREGRVEVKCNWNLRTGQALTNRRAFCSFNLHFFFLWCFALVAFAYFTQISDGLSVCVAIVGNRHPPPLVVVELPAETALPARQPTNQPTNTKETLTPSTSITVSGFITVYMCTSPTNERSNCEPQVSQTVSTLKSEPEKDSARCEYD